MLSADHLCSECIAICAFVFTTQTVQKFDLVENPKDSSLMIFGSKIIHLFIDLCIYMTCVMTRFPGFFTEPGSNHAVRPQKMLRLEIMIFACA